MNTQTTINLDGVIKQQTQLGGPMLLQIQLWPCLTPGFRVSWDGCGLRTSWIPDVPIHGSYGIVNVTSEGFKSHQLGRSHINPM